MTHSSHRFTMLSADDVALCRAHSEAIEQDGYSRMLVAEVVVESDFKRSGRAVLPADLPMPPSYWDDLEHWIKTLAPAKPAAPEAPFPAPPQLPPVPGLALADLHAYIRDRLASTSSADGAALIGDRPAEPRPIPVPWDQWHEKAMRDMVKPAQQPAQKASTHSVCIRAYGVWKVGDVARWDGAKQEIPANWLPCDESGWVTHAPTKEAGSPVPVGVLCCIKQDGGSVRGDTKSNPAREGKDWFGWDSIIIAWRPIAQS